MTNLEFYQEEIMDLVLGDGVGLEEALESVCDNHNTKPRSCNTWIRDMLTWYSQECKEKLTLQEKNYLSAVIEPFRDQVSYICKTTLFNFNAGHDFERIIIQWNCDNELICDFPPFNVGERYQGMTLDVEYTLEELGL